MDKAAFSIQDYSFSEVLLNMNNLGSDSDGLSIRFNPSGIFNKDTSTFDLDFEFSAFSNENPDKSFIRVKCNAIFKFDNVSSISEIPNYFYKNSIALIFPYVRAYVSLITNQANIRSFILPTLNLSELEKPLKENTTEV